MNSALGFIGTGTITHAIVTGLCNSEDPPTHIWVSPRSALKARQLTQLYTNVHVATSNQEVLDQADTVILAVLPQVAQAVLGELLFKESHHCISLVAGLSQEALLRLIRPATHWTRATPTPSVGQRRGPIAMFPPDPDALALFGKVGEPIAVRQESEFEALLSCSAEMAAFFKLLETCMAFLTDRGVADDSARQYAASLFGALGTTALHQQKLTFAHLAHEHATPGGLNEQLARELSDAGVFRAHRQALERIRARLAESHQVTPRGGPA
jgi:pyrroline-5-carboxylate reductase